MAIHWTKSGLFYVDAINGSDSNDGSSGSPVKTINKGIDLVEAGGPGNATLVVGTGVYNEMLTMGDATDYITIQGDGDVYIDGTGLDACLYNGYYWVYRDLNFINGILWKGTASAYYGNFYNCHFKDISDIWMAISVNTLGGHSKNFFDCIFENVKNNTAMGAYYWRYGIFNNCIFLNSNLFLNAAGNVGTANSYGTTLNNCLIAGDSGSIVSYALASTAFTTNCVFQPNLKKRFYGYDDPADGVHDLTNDNINLKNDHGNKIMSMSFNENVSGSGGLTTLSATMPLNDTNSQIWKQIQVNPAFSFIANAGPRTAYGYDDSSSNPLHTTGGATWDNIITSSLGGFQISSSADDNNTTASITTAIIDQGTSKIVKNISYNWATTVPNACGITVYTASAVNQNPVRYTYEMKYGDSSPPDSGYKIFEFNSTPYVDLNGSGSGDIGFNTGSYDNFSARYLQMKFTLRTNLSGSA